MISFTVIGRPQQRGSKNAALIPKRGGGWVTNKTGRPIVAARDDNENSKEWMGQVRDAAHAAYSGQLLQGPMKLTVRFYFKRLKGHFRSGKNSHLVRDSAPTYVDTTPDLDKLVRAICDSLTGVIVVDDKQIAAYGEGMGKYYTTEAERAEITIEELIPQEAQQCLTIGN